MKGLNAAPFRITDEDTGEWIEIKPVLSRGDTDWIEEQIWALKVQGGDTIGEIKTMNRLTLLLERAVTGWHLVDESGKEFPFSKANIAKLPYDNDLVDRVLAEIAERNPTRRAASASDESQETQAESEPNGSAP